MTVRVKVFNLIFYIIPFRRRQTYIYPFTLIDVDLRFRVTSVIMSTRGRVRKTAEERRPVSVQYPYQRTIWQDYLTVEEQKRYIKHISQAIRRNQTPSDVYDFYLKLHAADAQLPRDLPPRDLHWRPNEVTIPSQPPTTTTATEINSLADVEVTSPSTTAFDGDFTQGLVEILNQIYPSSQRFPPPPPSPSSASRHTTTEEDDRSRTRSNSIINTRISTAREEFSPEIPFSVERTPFITDDNGHEDQNLIIDDDDDDLDNVDGGGTNHITTDDEYDSTVTTPPRGPSRRRRRALVDVTTVPTSTVHRLLQTATDFFCDCRAGQQHDIDARQARFSLEELAQATDHDRCDLPDLNPSPRPFHASDDDHHTTRTGIDRLDFARLLGTRPVGQQARSRLRLRSSRGGPSLSEEDFHVTHDVDSAWLRLDEISDLVVPLEVTYTAARHLNITGPQYLPVFASDQRGDFDLHRTAHSLFAKFSLATCSARVYIFWPHVDAHRKTVLDDVHLQTWIDGVLAPAVATLDPCAWQDHPKSFSDARARAYHRGEVQIGGAQGPADVGYTLSPRFLPPLAQTMRQLVAQTGPTSPLYPFRAFSFAVVVHDLKRAFNAEVPRFDAFRQFQQALQAIFRPAYLTSTTFLDRSFVDFGVEYTPKRHVARPTTLLTRRTCLEHRLSAGLVQAGDLSLPVLSSAQLFTTYGLHDAATGRVVLPASTSMSSVVPTVKAYNLHKHTHQTHLRHHHAAAFSLPHLDLLCLTDELLKDLHDGVPGVYTGRSTTAIFRVLAQTFDRLQAALQAGRARHSGVRIEPRVSLRCLSTLGNQDREPWTSPFRPTTSDPSGRHPFIFALDTRVLNDFIQGYLQRMILALAAQRFDLFGPSPAWNSMTVRHRLGTTAVLLKILEVFFQGTERQHYNLRATRYKATRVRSRGHPRQLDDDGGDERGLDLTPIAVAGWANDVRIGLMMDAVQRRYGCYWLPHELFDFDPRPQLKPHLLTRVTVARPRLLGRVAIRWKAPVHSRQAYEGDVVFDIITTVGRRLRRLGTLPTEDDDYLRHWALRTRAWLIFKPMVLLLARGFFRYVASLTERPPYFLPVEEDDAGVPFHALTHDAVTRLLGEEPVLVRPRQTSKDGGSTDWAHRLRQMFDDTTDHQWQRTATHLVELRRWLTWLRQGGVSDDFLTLWRVDVGLLMRPFIWILPSHERKTLFRLDRVEGGPSIPPRLRTRWYLPGVTIAHADPIIVTEGGRYGPRFIPCRGRQRVVEETNLKRFREVDPFRRAETFLQGYTELNHDDEEAQETFIDRDIDDGFRFKSSSIEWFHDQINDRRHAAGRWVPLWACGQPFPPHNMNALGRRIARHQEQFEPEGGFHSILENHFNSEDRDDPSSQSEE